MRTDVYQKINDQIVAALEQGVRPWHQAWKADMRSAEIRESERVAAFTVTG